MAITWKTVTSQVDSDISDIGRAGVQIQQGLTGIGQSLESIGQIRADAADKKFQSSLFDMQRGEIDKANQYRSFISEGEKLAGIANINSNTGEVILRSTEDLGKLFDQRNATSDVPKDDPFYTASRNAWIAEQEASAKQYSLKAKEYDPGLKTTAELEQETIKLAKQYGIPTAKINEIISSGAFKVDLNKNNTLTEAQIQNIEAEKLAGQIQLKFLQEQGANELNTAKKQIEAYEAPLASYKGMTAPEALKKVLADRGVPDPDMEEMGNTLISSLTEIANGNTAQGRTIKKVLKEAGFSGDFTTLPPEVIAQGLLNADIDLPDVWGSDAEFRGWFDGKKDKLITSFGNAARQYARNLKNVENLSVITKKNEEDLLKATNAYANNIRSATLRESDAANQINPDYWRESRGYLNSIDQVGGILSKPVQSDNTQEEVTPEANTTEPVVTANRQTSLIPDTAKGESPKKGYSGWHDTTQKYLKDEGLEEQFDPTEMSIRDIIAFQNDTSKKQGTHTAAGMYQFTKKTLSDTGLLKAAGLTPDSQLTPENQDKLALAIIKSEPAITAYLTKANPSAADRQAALKRLGARWASFAVNENNDSYSALYGNAEQKKANPAKAKVTYDEALQFLESFKDLIA